MPQWMQDLTTGWPMIRANLPTFAVILVLMFAAVWWFVNYVHDGTVSSRDGIIRNKDSEIALLRSQIGLPVIAKADVVPQPLRSQKEKNDLIDAYRLITTNLEQKGKPAIELSRELEINWSNWDKFQGMGIRTKKQEAELASRLQKTLDDLDAAIFKDLLSDPGLIGLHQEIQLVLGSRAPLQSFRWHIRHWAF